MNLSKEYIKNDMIVFIIPPEEIFDEKIYKNEVKKAEGLTHYGYLVFAPYLCINQFYFRGFEEWCIFMLNRLKNPVLIVDTYHRTQHYDQKESIEEYFEKRGSFPLSNISRVLIEYGALKDIPIIARDGLIDGEIYQFFKKE